MMNAARIPKPTVTLFGAPGCHLCEEARSILQHAESRDELIVENVNIRSSTELEHEFGLRIPVARFPDGVELSWPFTVREVEAALQRAK